MSYMSGAASSPSTTAAAVAVTARRWLWPLVAVAAAVWLLFAMWPAAAVASYYAALRLHRRSALPGYVAVAAREQLTVLTDREHEVVRAVAEGLSNAEIGRVLTMR